MDLAGRAGIAGALPRRGWAPENHTKLVRFLATHGRAGALAMFDADNTAWAGDLGDTVLIHLVRSLGLSPRLHEILPTALDVPAAGFGVRRPGRLFPAARVAHALAAMTERHARLVQPSATAADLSRTFREGRALAGPLRGDATFANAYRVYAGTIVATYNLLEASVGCLARGPSGSPTLPSIFPDDARSYLGDDVRFPAVLDTGPDQASLRARGRLGSYSQIAVWEALDKTPTELGAIGLDAWEAASVDTPFDVIFPVDVEGARTPAPLDLAVDPARFAPGGAVAEGVAMGATAMLEGTRARPEMVELFAAMAAHGIVPAVITASQVDLVRAVLDRHYGFAGYPVVGMSPVLAGGRYGADLAAPATYGAGKVDAARAVARLVTGNDDLRPVLCAGDTTTDLELLAYSGGYRLFFDRGKRPFMDLAHHLVAHGHGERTIIQTPF